jgi:DNA-binding MarR family transcriptional regulator
MDDMTQRFRTAYWAMVHYVDILRLRAWEERGLTLPQLRILFQLRAQPETTTNAIARRLELTMPTVSGLVDKLCRAGLVVRGQRADDRRVIPLRLSEEGQAVVGEIREGNRAYLDALAEHLGEDLEAATLSLERLVDGIKTLPADTEGEGNKSAV